MRSQIERTTRALGKMAVTVAQCMDMHPGVTLSLVDGERWHCHDVAPAVWFGDVFLQIWSNPVDPWSRQGDLVKLGAANGTWVWKLTDQYRDGENIDGALTRRLAVWPD